MSTAPATPLRIRISGRARRVRVRVLPDGLVELVLPQGADPAAALAFAESNRAWIERTRARVLGRRRALEGQRRAVPDVIELPALGERWLVEPARGGPRPPRADVLAGRRLRLFCADPEEGLGLLRVWLRRRAVETLPDWLERIAARTGLSYTRVQVRFQRARWGSCSMRGAISLNAKLLLLAPELVDYLMIHELCHTEVMSHSPKFWRLVEAKLPGSASLDKSLRHAGRGLPAWVDPLPKGLPGPGEW